MARKRRPFVDDGGYPEYKRLCKETQGFDVNSVGRYLCGGVGQFHCIRKKDLKHVISIAEFALDDYNQKNNSDLRFFSLLKVNVQIVGGGMWYITFKAYSLTTRLIKVYQAKVWEKVLRSGFQVFIFREKSSSKEVAFPIQNPPESISTPFGAFLCFRNDIARVLQSEHGRKHPRRCIKSLASKAWRSMSTGAKYAYYHTRPLEYEDLAQFGLLNLPKKSEPAKNKMGEGAKI